MLLPVNVRVVLSEPRLAKDGIIALQVDDIKAELFSVSLKSHGAAWQDVLAVV